MLATCHVIRPPARRGFNLIETTVASGLTLLLASLILQFLLPGLRWHTQVSAESQVLRASQEALQRQVALLRVSPVASLGYDAQQGLLTGRTASRWSADGVVVYPPECWLIFWDRSQGRLGYSQMRWDRAPRLSMPDLIDHLKGLRWKWLCTGVVDWRLEHQGTVSAQPSGTCRLDFRIQLEGRQVRLSQSVTPRSAR